MEVVAEGITYLIVCAPHGVSEDQALVWARENAPMPGRAPWSLWDRKDPQRSAACLDGKGTHFMFEA